MKNKKKRLFKILFFPISMMFCLSLFLINSFASSGFEVDNSGNLISLNLFNINDIASGSSGNVDTSTGVVSGYDSKSVFNFQVQYITSNYNYYTIYSTDIYTPQKVSYTFTKTSDMYWLQFGHNGSSADIKVRYDIHNLDNTTYTISLNIISVSNPQSFDNIMLNSGSVALDYFPYGSYANNDIINRMSLYNLFNGSTVALNGYYENLNNSYTMAIDILNLSVDQKFITLDDLPTIKNVISEGRSGDEWIVNADTYYISFYLNRQQVNFDILFADFVSSRQYIRLSGSSSGLYDRFVYNTNENSQSFILSTNGVEYTNISLFNELGYNQNFKIGLSFSSSAYNDGYNDGYTSAINSSDAFNTGFNSGYQNGYNDGINTDLQTNGLRTLFNSILSFPVDMIKSVFNFEFMGVNIASVITFIISIGIVAFVLKKFL